MTATAQNRFPTHSVYVVHGEGKTARWTRIGAAWPNRDGEGFSIDLVANANGGRVVMRRNKPREEQRALL
ncbi:hypothetical protein [Sphingomonas sp.]|uniref:hypothetical protein n=1 Tax=Sphingomonas sp. TaxID=28214 RepID=UPI001B2A2389|nr:hypothetical protein [Sphingomonas sp.]MBO9712687.1 hypothetical protein [Sphingomonas sp.]